MKKLFSVVLPHFDKAETVYKIATVLYKVAMLLRDELTAILDNKTPPTPPSAPGLMMAA